MSLPPSSRTIIGPVVGGYLAEPVKHYPSLFGPDTIWERFPYLLPNLVVVVFLLASCVLGFLALEEVHPRFQGQIDLGHRVSATIQSLVSCGKSSDRKGRYTSIRTEEDPVGPPNVAESTADPAQAQSSNPGSAFTKQVNLQILSSTILGFLKVATLTIIPIFLETPSHPSSSADSEMPGTLKSIFGMNGGYGLDTQSASKVLLSQAVVAIVSQIRWVPTIIARHGPLTSYRLALFVLLVLYCVMPFAVALPKWPALAAIVVLLWLYALVNGLCTNCSVIL
jgi:hypothetical protein